MDHHEPTAGQHLKILFRASTSSLASVQVVERFLTSLVQAIGMRPLDVPHVYDVPLQVERMEAEPFEDEGGVTAEGFGVAQRDPDEEGVTGETHAAERVVGSLVLSTSHVAVHTWPAREWGVLDVYSCREFEFPIVYQELMVHFGEGFEIIRITDLSYSLHPSGGPRMLPAGESGGPVDTGPGDRPAGWGQD